MTVTGSIHVGQQFLRGRGFRRHCGLTAGCHVERNLTLWELSRDNDGLWLRLDQQQRTIIVAGKLDVRLFIFGAIV